MRFKEWWKKLKGWQKGGIIGFLIPVVPFLIGFLLSDMLFFVGFINNSTRLLMTDVFSIPLGLFVHLFDFLLKKRIIDCMGEACALGGYHMLIAMLSPIIYALIGIVTGVIIEKYKKRKND